VHSCSSVRSVRRLSIVFVLWMDCMNLIICFLDLLVIVLRIGGGMVSIVAPKSPSSSMSTNRPLWSVLGHGASKKAEIPEACT
jgi:hypothetical protein